MFDFLTTKGNELFNKFHEYYYEELECLRKEYNDPEYTEGWCIIDTPKYVKTLEDICGVLIYGEDENAIGHVELFIETWGEDEVYNLGYTGKEVLNELARYYK